VSAAFLICWWPYAIIFMLGRLVLGTDHGKLLGNVVVPAYLNSLINPILYIVISKDVRNGFKNLILCRDIPTHERQLTSVHHHHHQLDKVNKVVSYPVLEQGDRKTTAVLDDLK